MNIFYCPSSQINGNIADLGEQEARHVSKVLRYSEGDRITFVDGEGGWYEGKISQILEKSVFIKIASQQKIPKYSPFIILGMGIIKKRDRLEFAVEKAVELGAGKICLFRSEHTVKENVRIDRLQATALAAMKQSLRAWLPEIQIYNSLEDLFESHQSTPCLVAHEKVNAETSLSSVVDKEEKLDEVLLLVGPEGGFSSEEIDLVQQKGGRLISLGDYRLRTETAVLALLSQV